MSEMIPWGVNALAILVLAGALMIHHLSMEKQMGIVLDTLKSIDSNLTEASTEIPVKLAELQGLLEARVELTPEELDLIEAIQGKAEALADIVDNSVTEPLPDPNHSENLVPEDAEVIDPLVSVVDQADKNGLTYG